MERCHAVSRPGDNPGDRAALAAVGLRGGDVQGWGPALTCRRFDRCLVAEELQKGSREVAGNGRGHLGRFGDRPCVCSPSDRSETIRDEQPLPIDVLPVPASSRDAQSVGDRKGPPGVAATFSSQRQVVLKAGAAAPTACKTASPRGATGIRGETPTLSPSMLCPQSAHLP